MGSVIAEKSFQFAVRVVRLYQYMCNEKREFVMSKQFLRCGTSIGANVHEALQAQGKRDFLSKINISLKEAYETQYWIKLLHATDYLEDKHKESMLNDCKELTNMLVSAVKTTKKNLEKE